MVRWVEPRIVLAEAEETAFVMCDQAEFAVKFRQPPVAMIVTGLAEHQRKFVRQRQVAGSSEKVLRQGKDHLVNREQGRSLPAADDPAEFFQLTPDIIPASIRRSRK